MRWVYVLFTLIPTLLGWLITFTTLSVIIGPPLIVVGPTKQPANLVVEQVSPNVTRDGLIIQLTAHNYGDEDLVITRIRYGNVSVVSSSIIIRARSREIITFLIHSRYLPRRLPDSLEITVYWSSNMRGQVEDRILVHIPRRG